MRANLPTGVSWKASNLHAMGGTPWVGMGAVGHGKVARTGTTGELHRQALSAKFGGIC